MPRAKQAARRGKAHKASRGGRIELESSFMPFQGTYPNDQGHASFTLQQEARNTERHHSFWNSDQRLRHTKVNFVSAGTLDNKELEGVTAEFALANMSLDSPPKEEPSIRSIQPEIQISDPELYAVPPPTVPDLAGNEDTPLPFVFDIFGAEPVKTGLPPPQVRAPSPTPSNSSEEVILFRGRKHRKETNIIDTKIKIVEDKIQEQEELLENVLHSKTRTSPQFLNALESNLSEIPPVPPRRKRVRGKAKQSSDDALLADYIANMDSEADILESNTFRSRDLGGTDDDIWLDQSNQSSGEPVGGNQVQSRAEWDPSDLHDFDYLSTSDGSVGEVEAVVSKREREAGVQYLVVPEAQSVDEARWVAASSFTNSSALAKIEAFEIEDKLLAEILVKSEETSDSGDNMDDGSEEDEKDEDLIQRKVDQMSDGQIARLLSKQEELGMGSGELLLFDDSADAEEDEAGILPEDQFFSSIVAQQRNRPKGRGMKRPRGEFPPANALADAYDGFDVMDFERPGLKKKPKGRKGKLVFDLSDSELEASMQIGWENDRLKKKERKQRREELRAQGLLGSKNGKPNLKGKYKEGMGIHAVKDEIKNFLMGDHTTLSLPPMDKADRKIVHELANAFNLKSKSLGSGATRFPVLYRTSRTSVYAEGKFAAVESRLTRRFLSRMDVGGKKSGPRASRGGGGYNAAVSYRDGDVVGGSAPELGVDNKGRAMLEKMGWSTGTALGALNNKGILQPVSHVVKTTKAGLG
ncbi:hypothetical protein G7Y89_g5331 [Cudoniella acicularis]|uniref:Protein SQS1 n=1 Tax=Cudoniella acicularis TaxID=354080 RepID=A0A8H4RMN8_9HELO|nr:hypothetical protein G7Y89_g5331 [Cudoniella acicularis]